ncbi:MAG: hypothetical protein R2794_07075 [Chitinophagales bacterium]
MKKILSLLFIVFSFHFAFGQAELIEFNTLSLLDITSEELCTIPQQNLILLNDKDNTIGWKSPVTNMISFVIDDIQIIPVGGDDVTIYWLHDTLNQKYSLSIDANRTFAKFSASGLGAHCIFEFYNVE